MGFRVLVMLALTPKLRGAGSSLGDSGLQGTPWDLAWALGPQPFGVPLYPQYRYLKG